MRFTWPWRSADRKSGSTWQTFRDFFQVGTKSGAIVNADTALQIDTALACGRVIAEGIAQVPFRVYRKDGAHREIYDAHPVANLISSQPNEWQTSFEFREQIALHLVFCGNAFVFKNTLVNGKIYELLPFEPGHVQVTRRPDRTCQYMVRTVGGQMIEVPAANMWHIRGPSWNGWMGLDAVKLGRETLGLALATEEHSARMFSNGAKIGGLLTTEANLNEEQVKALRASWQDAQGGNANAYKTAMLYGGLKWQPLAMQNDQAQLLEQRAFQVSAICRWARVMPIMVGAGDKTATYASAEQMFIAHVTHTMAPWYSRLEQSANVNLLSRADRAAGVYTKFNANALLRGAVRDRGEFYTRMYGIGALNPNEIRELEDLNPYQGGEAYRVPLNMVDPTNEPAPPAA